MPPVQIATPFHILPSSHATPHTQPPETPDLVRELTRTVRGEVRFDPGARALYATDASNYRHIPIGLVVPHDADDVRATVAACRRFNVPILARGGGTSLAGQATNVAVVLDFSKYMRGILSTDPTQRLMRVEPGIVLDRVRDSAELHHLTFAPDPATHSRCTIGGMIGNNSCGVHSVMGGKTVDNIRSMRVLLYDGTEMEVGPTPEPDLAQLCAGSGRQAEIYRGLRTIRDQYANLVREKFPRIPRRVSGYNLDELLPENGFHVARALVGSEGTCVTVLEATLELTRSPQFRILVGVGFSDVFLAADHVPQILAFKPIGLEGMDALILKWLRLKRFLLEEIELLPRGEGYLLVEFGGFTPEQAALQATAFAEAAATFAGNPHVRVYSAAEALQVWRVREAGLGATANVPGEPHGWEGWEDAAVAPARLGSYLRALTALMRDFGYRSPIYGHFGDGCVHMRHNFDLVTEPGILNFRRFIEQAADIAIAHGGSLSGEHGDGQARGALLPKLFGPELVDAFRQFKRLWDPDNRMNPGKLIDAREPHADLRLGADFNPWQPETHFAFHDDHGSLAHAAGRCVGVGACRKQDTGTMCPSFMVTGEERESTRGRARLLWELMQNEVLPGGWRNHDVKAALDLCLACKACKTECPVGVDMATYKAEFLSHYYEGRLPPLRSLAFGYVNKWAHLGSLAPTLANAALTLTAPLAKAILGIHPDRELPHLSIRKPVLTGSEASLRARLQPGPHSSLKSTASATQTAELSDALLRARLQPCRNSPLESAALAAEVCLTDPTRPTVLLWPDTFNRYFHPQTYNAAAIVLNEAGFHVTSPSGHLCCGRPLYDFGLLKSARRYLLRILDALAEPIAAGIPVVVLEPSCASVFRDELTNLLPNDDRAHRLRAHTFLLSEFLAQHAPHFKPPTRTGKVVVQAHCHHRAQSGMRDEMALLTATGADATLLDSGCCGMAGPFGFEKEKFAVSQTIAERVLLPAVRAATPETILIADGFSCREQITQNTGRRALHLAEYLAGTHA